jgi:Tol biopolymer transport system component
MSAVSASWHPNSKYIAFSGYTVGDEGWSVYVMDVENEKMFKICLGRNPVFTPDGGTIVYDRDGTVYSRDIKIYSRGAK